ncbi:MAG: tetratricopeptide repeat protein [Gemmatimonadaceae bacterium]|nr:tetratricopeptide repeat protein [Gemmatimonadaceae bacterium]
MMRARSPSPWYRSDSALGILLIAAVLAAYWPALAGTPVWDDDRHITSATLQGWDGLRRIWFTLGATQQYYPVLHSAFWVEYKLWGELMPGYHLVNAGLHSLSACLLVLVARALGVRGGWIAAFIFALHPVHAESVAWISEQKNTLSLVFYLLAVLAWLRFDDSRSSRAWWAGFLFFALALGSKTVTATLPCALLVAAWWKRGRIEWKRDAAPLVPWLVLGMAGGLLTAWVERHLIGAEGAEHTLSIAERLLVAGRALWHYLGAFAWPSSLAFMYPRWTLDARNAGGWLYPASALLLLAVLWRMRRQARAPLAVFLVFAGTLFPAIGFLNVYPFRYSFVADHFQYHADVALALPVGATLTLAPDFFARALSGPLARAARTSLAAPALLAAALAVLGALTWRQAGEYRDAESLYRAVLAANPASWMAHNNLGRMLLRRADGLDEAIAHFEAAIGLKPDHARAHYSLGLALQRAGRGAEAVPHLEAAERMEPFNRPLVASAEYLLGLESLSQPHGAADAVRHFTASLVLMPGVADVEQALARAREQAARDSVSR